MVQQDLYVIPTLVVEGNVEASDLVFLRHAKADNGVDDFQDDEGEDTAVDDGDDNADDLALHLSGHRAGRETCAAESFGGADAGQEGADRDPNEGADVP